MRYQRFYWDRVYEERGFSSLEDFLIGFWERLFLDDRDANNLLTMLWTWQNGDIGKTPGMDGDYERALGSIEARAIVMPAEKDLYYPAGGRGGRGGAHEERGAAGDSGCVGALCRGWYQRERHRVYRRRAQGVAGGVAAARAAVRDAAPFGGRLVEGILPVHWS